MKLKVVIFICLIFSLFLISPVVLTLFKTPPNTVNMLVGHYYEDYYEYLSFIKQGQKGNLIPVNFFDNNDRSSLFSPWWPYSLMGFVSYIFHLDIPPSIIYWIGAGTFSFILLTLTFIAVSTLLKKERPIIQLMSFLLIITSSGFFNIFDTLKDPLHKIIPYDFWYSAGSPFSRYNIGTPHHQITHIIFLIMVLFAINHYQKPLKLITFAVYFILSLLLLTLSPPQLLLFWLAYLVATIVVVISHLFTGDARDGFTLNVFTMKGIPNGAHPPAGGEHHLGKLERQDPQIMINKMFLPLITTIICLAPIAYFFYKYSLSSPAYISAKLWDIHHFYYPGLSLFILTTGPLILLALFGLIVYFSKLSFEKLFFFFITFFSFLFILVPINISPTGGNILAFIGIHNQRFNTPHSYLFLGVAAILFIKAIFKKPVRIVAVSLLILIFSSLSLFGSWLAHSQDPYSVGFLQFIPKEQYIGLQVLEKDKDDSVVLASPQSLLGLIIPAVSNKRVYLGRSIFTMNLDEKTAIANKFYSMNLTPNEAREFLIKENIGIILLSTFEPNEKEFFEHYNFLKIEYKNSNLTIIRIINPIEN